MDCEHNFISMRELSPDRNIIAAVFKTLFFLKKEMLPEQELSQYSFDALVGLMNIGST